MRTRAGSGTPGTDQSSGAQRAFYEALQAWRSRLPQTPDALPASVAGLAPNDRAGLLALLSAASLNIVSELLTDGQVATSAVALPSADASNAVEGNPFTAADWQFRRMLLEERVPAQASLDLIRRFGTECRLDDADEAEAPRG